MHRLRVWCAATGLALGALALPATASAQGFGVYEHSACAMGRAGATVAATGPSVAAAEGAASARHELVMNRSPAVRPHGPESKKTV